MILYHFYPNRVEQIEVLNEYSFPGKLAKDDEWYWEEMEEELEEHEEEEEEK